MHSADRGALATKVASSATWLPMVAIFLICPIPAFAADKEPTTPQTAVGKLVTQDGSAFRRPQSAEQWDVLKEGNPVQAGDVVLGLPGATIEGSNGAVRLAFFADLDEKSPLPIIESAVVLQPASGADLALALDRGRVDLTNRKDQGPARVRVQCHGETWELTLAEPGTRVAIEIYGRWAPGTRFVPGAKGGPQPSLTAIVLVLKGKVTLKAEKKELVLTAPPGNALVQWDSVGGLDDKHERLEKLPDWAQPEDEQSALVKARREAIGHLRELVLSKGITPALAELLDSDKPAYRRLAVRACGAFDQLLMLGMALNAGKHPDLWEWAVVTLRHWIGRRPGQDDKLYKNLVEKGMMPPAQARTIVQLLHSFDETEVRRPELYETLIEYLRHERLGIRGLAYWHLHRLVPAGRKIAYNPNGTPEERKQAYEEWKKLVPNGQLPPSAKDK